MRQDETALVREALRQAQERLERGQAVLPAAYMLVRINPQTGAALTHPTAVGLTCDAPFESPEAYHEFVASVREEARRLQASAVAISGEAEAEIEGAGELQRVFYMRVEDADGVHHLHAAIEAGGKLGALYDAGAAEDDLVEPLLPRALH
jgi:hypothetical protein